MSTKGALYSAAGEELTRFEGDVDSATLVRRESFKAPASVQYAWPHPSKRFLYVATSNCGPAAIAPNGGYGFGPRHLDVHPGKPKTQYWAGMIGLNS